MEEFLKGYVEPPIKSVADIVRYNSAHQEAELPAGKVTILEHCSDLNADLINA